MNKNKIVVEYHVFDQLKTFIQELKSMIGALLKRIKLLSARIDSLTDEKYSLQGTTQGNGLTGGVPPVRFSM